MPAVRRQLDVDIHLQYLGGLAAGCLGFSDKLETAANDTSQLLGNEYQSERIGAALLLDCEGMALPADQQLFDLQNGAVFIRSDSHCFSVRAAGILGQGVHVFWRHKLDQSWRP